MADLGKAIDISVICFLTSVFVLCHLFSVICFLSFVLCLLVSVYYPLFSDFRIPNSEFHRLSSFFCHLDYP